MSKFSERFSELLFDDNKSIEELHEIINYSKTEIYHWLEGKYMPSMKFIILLANHFKCTIDYFVGRENENSATMFAECPKFSEHFRVAVKEMKSNFNKIIVGVGISSNTIYCWNSEKHQPQIESLIRVADFLNCSIDYLVGREL